ncbi:MAG: transcription termination/antitermination protein NusG [Methylocystis sp.]|uniref:transcription termination/antitermination protein NusG n=1 Tax=Methylocystis sp. TaxID=1911079 RepID=UPI003DA69B03
MGETDGGEGRMAWHVIECFEGKDREVYGRLAALGFEVWRPVLKVRPSTRWSGKPLEAKRQKPRYVAIFGRYLFIHIEMTDSVYGAIKEQPGVEAWLCFAGSNEPATVPDALIEHYRQFKPERVDTATVYKNGDIVRALQGPFATFHGVVDRIDSRGVLCVEMSIFGRPTPIIFPVGHVELVEQSRRLPIERDVKQRPRKRA